MARVTSVGTAFGGRPGPKGDRGPTGGGAGSSVLTFRAGANLSGNRIVRASGDSMVLYASNHRFLDAHGAFGITVGSALAGTDVDVQVEGRMVEPTWNWVPELPVFVGVNG